MDPKKKKKAITTKQRVNTLRKGLRLESATKKAASGMKTGWGKTMNSNLNAIGKGLQKLSIHGYKTKKK